MIVNMILLFAYMANVKRETIQAVILQHMELSTGIAKNDQHLQSKMIMLSSKLTFAIKRSLRLSF